MWAGVRKGKKIAHLFRWLLRRANTWPSFRLDLQKLPGWLTVWLFPRVVVWYGKYSDFVCAENVLNHHHKGFAISASPLAASRNCSLWCAPGQAPPPCQGGQSGHQVLVGALPLHQGSGVPSSWASSEGPSQSLQEGDCWMWTFVKNWIWILMNNIGREKFSQLDVSGNVHALGIQLGDDLPAEPSSESLQE